MEPLDLGLLLYEMFFLVFPDRLVSKFKEIYVQARTALPTPLILSPLESSIEIPFPFLLFHLSLTGRLVPAESFKPFCLSAVSAYSSLKAILVVHDSEAQEGGVWLRIQYR